VWEVEGKAGLLDKFDFATGCPNWRLFDLFSSLEIFDSEPQREISST